MDLAQLSVTQAWADQLPYVDEIDRAPDCERLLALLR
jgi:hypothetical protein